jgi:hypothetical protein
MLGVESMRVAIDIEASKQRVAPDSAADYKGDAYAGEKVYWQGFGFTDDI